MTQTEFTISIRQLEGFAFQVDFGADGLADLILDEPEPLGQGSGPAPSQVLAAAVGTCLSASLLFCMRKARIENQGMETHVDTLMTRNNKGRLRIGEMKVTLEVDLMDAEDKRLARCAEIFKDYCVVTESVKKGIPIDVDVRRKDSGETYQ